MGQQVSQKKVTRLCLWVEFGESLSWQPGHLFVIAVSVHLFRGLMHMESQRPSRSLVAQPTFCSAPSNTLVPSPRLLLFPLLCKHSLSTYWALGREKTGGNKDTHCVCLVKPWFPRETDRSRWRSCLQGVAFKMNSLEGAGCRTTREGRQEAGPRLGATPART